MTTPVLIVVLAAFLQATSAAPPEPSGLALTGEEAENFLRNAEVVEIEEFETKGITEPRRAILNDGTIEARAVFKDVDEFHNTETLTSGRTVARLKDSYRHEIAAYEVDKLLGLDIVPPCVERKIKGDRGSLCMWVEGAMTEWTRSREEFIQPPDIHAFNDQVHTIKLFMQLLWDTDYNNISNILIDKQWKLYKVDSSRTFRNDRDLRREEGLSRFSRSFVEALEKLDPEQARERLSPWLDKAQIKGFLARRDAILKLVDKRVAKQGEAAVLYP
jgi:hypothetical protein